MQFDWERLMDMYNWSFYTIPPIIILASYTALRAATAKFPSTITKVITAYAAASALQYIFISINFLYTPLFQAKYVAAFSVVLFMVIELGCCYCLVKASGISILQHKAMQLLLLLFVIYGSAYTYLNFFKGFYDDEVGLIQLPIMLFYCCIYYYNLIKHPPKQALLKHPLFWTISGMCFVAILLLPFSLVTDYLGQHSPTLSLLHVIPNFCYVTLFITHLKALQCNQQKP